MRKLLLLALVPLALATAAPATAATAISITNSGFAPAAVTIGASDTVTWTNNDSVKRQVVSRRRRLQLRRCCCRATSCSFTFPRAGAFPTTTAEGGEKGTITVRPTGGALGHDRAHRAQIVLGSSLELSGSISAGAAASR